jgi:hypothetical protein
MSNEQNRILSYKLATVLEREDLQKVSGGSSSVKTVRSQWPRSTQGGDETIDFDAFDFA